MFRMHSIMAVMALVIAMCVSLGLYVDNGTSKVLLTTVLAYANALCFGVGAYLAWWCNRNIIFQTTDQQEQNTKELVYLVPTDVGETPHADEVVEGSEESPQRTKST